MTCKAHLKVILALGIPDCAHSGCSGGHLARLGSHPSRRSSAMGHARQPLRPLATAEERPLAAVKRTPRRCERGSLPAVQWAMPPRRTPRGGPASVVRALASRSLAPPSSHARQDSTPTAENHAKRLHVLEGTPDARQPPCNVFCRMAMLGRQGLQTPPTNAPQWSWWGLPRSGREPPRRRRTLPTAL